MAHPLSDPLHDRLSTPIDVAGLATARREVGDRELRFVYEVARRAGIDTWADARDATRWVLGALGEWLAPARRGELARQLPGDVGDALGDARSGPPRCDDVVHLYLAAASRQRDAVSLHEVALRCAAVLAVTGETVSEPVIRRVVDDVPSTIGALLGSGRPPDGTEPPGGGEGGKRRGSNA